jgi:hypothetical protein
LLITISLITALTCAVLAVFSVIQQRALIRLALDRELDLAYRSVIAAFDYEGRVGVLAHLFADDALLPTMPQPIT